MSKILDLATLIQEARRNFFVLDAGENVGSGTSWTNTDTGGGSGTAFTAGYLTITTGATSNNLGLRALTNARIAMATGLPAAFEVRLKFTEASTNQANLFVGFSSALPSDTLQASPSGPLTSFTGCGFFKEAGTTNWQIINSVGTVQNIVNLSSTNTLNKQTPASGGGAFQVLRVEISNVTATSAEVVYMLDSGTSGPVEVYKQTWTWTGAVAMSAGVEIKAGTTASEVLTVDYMAVQQERF